MNVGNKFNRNTLFTNDLLYQYMLNSDTTNIKSLMQLDKSAYQLCNHHFWTTKLLYDNLPIVKTNNTMMEYEKILNITKKIKSLLTFRHFEFMNVIGNLSPIFNNVKFDYFYNDHSKPDQIQNIEIKGDWIRLTLKSTSTILADFYLLHLSLNDILFKLFYNQPDVEYCINSIARLV